MPTNATTIYNRAGTIHTWHWDKHMKTSTRGTVMVSLCGLRELFGNLQSDGGLVRCRKCKKANGE